MVIELNVQEASSIILACETLMEQIKDDDGDMIKYYDLWDIRNKLNDLR